ncbi:MAG: FkbM family methyltransferase [Phycisphaeraceae bacterium]|nr:FkbM family methyltransferase [Phycisphaeraceae bacterium]
MAKLFREFLRRTLYRGKGNLYTLDDPYQILSKLLKDQNITGIIDAGASDGRVGQRLLKRFSDAQVYQFEPNPIYAQTLGAKQNQNNRFHPFYVALSDQSGELELQNTVSPGNVSMFKPNAMLHNRYGDSAKVQGVIKVPVTTLDTWWHEQGKPDVQLMKFDIQGAELKALKGAGELLDSGVQAIYSEVFINPLYEGAALFSDIDLLLREHGFDLYNIYAPRHDTKTGMLLWAHSLYVHRDRLMIT